MFTGLVEEVGEILNISKGVNSARLDIKGNKVLDEVNLGDSIAVNGVCLTVTDFTHGSFSVDVMAETLRKSSLGILKKGSKVNLERAMASGGRFGGHIVSGHIDGVGKIVNIKEEDIATWVTIETSEDILKYIVSKGSIALDGISLTVGDLNEKSFSVSLIPHTKQETSLYFKKVNDTVNIECDVIGKYVERLLFMKDKPSKKESRISKDFLRDNGFI